ncbi:hypothetical protein I3843_14G033300 [Carya illinoinensis]|nr:hypothetical protein I3843_14G033300 [Carya illinoinensis]
MWSISFLLVRLPLIRTSDGQVRFEILFSFGQRQWRNTKLAYLLRNHNHPVHYPKGQEVMNRKRGIPKPHLHLIGLKR